MAMCFHKALANVWQMWVAGSITSAINSVEQSFHITAKPFKSLNNFKKKHFDKVKSSSELRRYRA